MSTKRYAANATRAKEARITLSKIRVQGVKGATVSFWGDGDKVIQMRTIKGTK